MENGELTREEILEEHIGDGCGYHVEEKPEMPFPKEYVGLWEKRGYKVGPVGCLEIRFLQEFRTYIYPMHLWRRGKEDA